MDIEVSFEDLMRECNIANRHEFGRILRRNGFQISPNHPIAWETANEIARRLTGYNLDKYTYKQRRRDIAEPGPLERRQFDSISELIEKWYREVTADGTIQQLSQDRILGLVCNGGFWGDAKTSYFVIAMDPAVNILIGDRGSGKSTVLNLLGVLADSVSEETDVLVNKLLELFKTTKQEESEFNRRVRRLLYRYSIQVCAYFYIKKERTFCYYVDATQQMYDLLRRDGQQWKSHNEGENIGGPSILLLQQSEVLRISEERNRFYLNNILDALYPNLHRDRVNVAQGIKGIINQFEKYDPQYVSHNSSGIYRFLEQRSAELQDIWYEIDRGYISTSSINIMSWYIDWFYTIDRQVLPTTIYELLQGDEDSFIYLYLARIIGFFTKSVREIDRLRQRQITESERKKVELLNRSESEDQMHGPDGVRLQESILDDKETLESIGESNLVAEASPTAVVRRDPDQTDKDHASFGDLLQIDEVSRQQMLEKATEVADFLRTRLRVLRTWVRIFSGNHVDLDKPLQSLLQNYAHLLESRIALVNSQECICQTVTNLLNKDESFTRIFTVQAGETIARYTQEITLLIDRIYACHQTLMGARPEIRLRELLSAATEYDEIFNDFMTEIRTLRQEIGETQPRSLFTPIEVELRQGCTYRAFHQLSFGQKSGIILRIVLSVTDKRVIVLDQPEDNLDASSVVNMLAPTLSRLGRDRQVIVATHDSNLTMGLPEARLTVLESLGDTGRIRLQGLLTQRDVVREMLDVLEGGIPAFNKKMRLYEDFANRLTGLIRDMDIAIIESSFRRRTIDGLRNFLQPVVSERSLMDISRHELKNQDPARIRKDLINIREQMNPEDGYTEAWLEETLRRVDRACERLDGHIERLKNAIEDLRLMDTQAHPSVVDLYRLLVGMKEQYLLRLRGSRDIHIEIDPQIEGKFVYADGDHLRLVFRNLLHNALRATERRAITAFRAGRKMDHHEVVRFELIEVMDDWTVLSMRDNGCGMPQVIREKLYTERCSDQKGGDHGLGGVIIRKLLDLNGGDIQVLESSPDGKSTGTLQRIVLRNR